MSTFTFEDGSFQDYTLRSPDLDATAETAMFAESLENSPEHEGAQALMSLFDSTPAKGRHSQPDYSNLCLDMESTRNRGIHFAQCMRSYFSRYSISSVEQYFFRNNSIFDEERFHILCDHLAVNRLLLKEVLHILDVPNAKKMIQDTMILRVSAKKLAMPGQTKNAVSTSTVVSDSGMKFLLSCMSRSLSFPAMCSSCRVLCSSQGGGHCKAGFQIECLQQVQQRHRPGHVL